MGKVKFVSCWFNITRCSGSGKNCTQSELVMQKLQVSFDGGIEMKMSSKRVKLHYCSGLVQWKLMEVHGIILYTGSQSILFLFPSHAPQKTVMCHGLGTRHTGNLVNKNEGLLQLKSPGSGLQ